MCKLWITLPSKTCHSSTTFTCTIHNTKKTLRFVFQLSYHRQMQMTPITYQNISSRLTYHWPNHWQALQRHTTTWSPPGIDINTCTGLLTRLNGNVIHKQVRHGTVPSYTNKTDLMSSPRANNPPWTHLCGLIWAYLPGGHFSPNFFSARRNNLQHIWASNYFFTCTSISSPKLVHSHRGAVVLD